MERESPNSINEYVSIEYKTYKLLKDLVPYKAQIQNKINKTEYAKNIFIMTKYRAYNNDLSNLIIEKLKEKGFNGIRADNPDWSLTGDSVFNPLAVLYCCKYGIAIFDDPEDGQHYGANVAYELGIMHYQHKNCLILIHNSISDKKPFDLLGKMHSVYKDRMDIPDIIGKWLTKIASYEDLSLGEDYGIKYPKWDKAYLYFELGYSMNQYLLDGKKEKWMIHATNICEKMGIHTDKMSLLKKGDVTNFGFEVLSHANLSNEKKDVDYFRISYYFILAINEITKKSNYRMLKKLNDTITLIKLPQELIENYQHLQKELESCNKGQELVAINKLNSFMGTIRDFISSKR